MFEHLLLRAMMFFAVMFRKLMPRRNFVQDFSSIVLLRANLPARDTRRPDARLATPQEQSHWCKTSGRPMSSRPFSISARLRQVAVGRQSFWANAQSLFIADRTARSGPGHIASSWMADLKGWNEQATNRDSKPVLSFGMRVRRSIFLAQQCICLGISNHELLLWIPRQASAQLHRVVRQDARRG